MRQIAPLVVSILLLGLLAFVSERLPTSESSERALVARALATADGAATVTAEVALYTSTPTPSPTPTPTPSSTPSATVTQTTIPSATATRTPTNTPHPTPLPTPSVHAINGLAFERIVVMNEAVKANVRAIYKRGALLGRNPHAFGKLGDSTTEPPLAYNGWDAPGYKLGAYGHLSATLLHFAGSFSHTSLAVVRGMGSAGMFDETWVKPGLCDGDADQHKTPLGPLPCEVSLHNPSLMLVRIGSNDDGSTVAFEANMRKAVQFLIDAGVVPIVGTKADRNADPENTKNAALRRIAASLQVPLWDLDLLTDTLADHGINTTDHVHLTYYFSYDFTDPTAFVRGHGLQNLSALVALDEVWRVVR